MKFLIKLCLSLLIALLIGSIAAPSQAHWADMAAAEIVVEETAMQMTLTFPTGLIAFGDDDRSGQLSSTEIRAHVAELQNFLNQQIRVTNSDNQPATLTVDAIAPDQLPPTVQAAPNTHSTLLLSYTWNRPLQGLKIHYNLFLPDVSTASCLTTILQNGQLKTFVFTPKQQHLALTPGLGGATGGLLAIAAAFLWGAVHSMSPGHGKTIVGAYLVGDRATPKHAVFLALTTTITHTIGVFALGLIAQFATAYILPEQLYPWLSLISGVMVAAIGFNLLRDRITLPERYRVAWHDHSHPPDHSHHPHFHSHEHHSHSHSHPHSHDHEQHHHSHLPIDADGSPVTWRNLLALGISGGLVPCPAALVLLLSTIALGNISLGLILVLSFSVGLAGVLTSLGLLMVYAKRAFQRVPTQLKWFKIIPALSATVILLIGCGISTKAILAIEF